MQSSFSADGQRLLQGLHAVSATPPAYSGDMIHVGGVAGNVYFVYEQLRNAAEYNEQHLLLRAAIERFLRRNLLFRTESPQLALELITELTQARYLPNDSVPQSAIAQVDDFIRQYTAIGRTLQQDHQIKKEKAFRWIVQILSVCIEKILTPQPVFDVFIDFAHNHYAKSIQADSFGDSANTTQFQDALYIGMHRALLKSDIATVRFYMMRSKLSNENPLQSVVDSCMITDALFQAPMTNAIARLIDRNGAPMRILQATIMSDPQSAVATLSNPEALQKRLRIMCGEQYKEMHARLKKGVWRAVAFIFITKMLVGLGIEIPYDLVVLGHIAMLPLLVNLLFPPLYMASVLLSLKTPGQENTEAIVGHITKMIFEKDGQPAIQYVSKRGMASGGANIAFNIVYAIAFAVSFGLVVWLLASWQFTLVHMMIFFVFISAVSFLRFRLLQAAREVELVERRVSILGVIADFFYTPFIKLGQWLSDRYRRVNIISTIMDIAIELPLKTSLRVLQQWAGFVRDKRDGV